MFNTMNLNTDVFTGNFGIEKNTSILALLDVCFSDDFADITIGDNTSTNGSGTAWAGNANFPTVDRAYQAGGAVKLGTGSAIGSIQSKELDDVEGDITVNIMVKGWTTVEGDLKVSIDGQEEILSYTALRTEGFEEVTATFTGVTAGSKLKIETTAKRAFIDSVEVLCEDTTPGVVYCTPEGTNANRYINNFSTTGGIQNISNLATGFSTGGYGDFFDTHTVEQIAGDMVEFSTDIVGGTSGFRIWVDWNQDGVFDTAEEVAYASSGYASSHSGSFEIPTDALLGTTRMRIVNHWLSASGDVDPCATGFSYGEFEDYKFVVSPMADCAGTPDGGTVTVAPTSGNPGATYTVSSAEYTVGNGMSYQWQSNTDGAGWVNEGTAAANYSSYSATAPSEIGVEVEWRLEVTCTLSNESAFSSTATFTTALTYCNPTITSTVEPITRVIFADIDNASPVNSTIKHEDFTSVEGNVELGETYDIALEGFTGGNYTNAFTVWIDWNQNGTFEATEMYPIGTIVNSTGTDGKQALGSITVPAYATEGSTRMRVIKNFSSSPTNPCGSYSFGQIEDYTIIVDGGVVAPEGCLDAPNGQYPFATFTPSCIGTPEEITDLGWTGEFSKVNVIAATDYTFSSSIATDYVTISNEAGTEVYAAGVSPLVWTATNTEVVRFYIHLDDECNFVNSGLRARLVQCGEPVIIEEPDFDCFQGDGITSSFDNSYNIDASNAFRTADDFTVEPGIEFTLRQITIDVNQQNVPNNAVINIREDNAGTPGAILDVVTMAPTSSIAYGEAFGDPIHHLTFDLATPLVYTEGTYWIEPKMSTASNETVWWLATSTGTNGAIAQRSTDDGITWAPDSNGLQMVFFVAGDCDAVSEDGCDWTVTVSSDTTFGDEVTWELRDSDGDILLSGGNYSGIPYSDTQTVNANGPLEFFISSDGMFGDNTPNYSVSNENGVIVSGLLPGGTTATFSDLNCSDTPPPPPAYTCEDQNVPSNNLENGLFFGGDTNQSLAVDVIVGDNGFSVYGVDLNIFTDGVTDLNFSFVFYDDAGGLPGAQSSTANGSVLVSELVGNAFGYDVYKYTVKFDTPVVFAANSTYWMEVETDGFAWEARTGTTLGSGLVFNNDSTGGDWVDGSPDELVYAMICEELGVSDMNSFDFSYYPNPVRDVLNIQSQKSVKSVEAFNLTGQKVISDAKVLNGQINVNALTSGTYVFRVTLEGGQVETFKIIKK
jgi:hypothetical protein